MDPYAALSSDRRALRTVRMVTLSTGRTLCIHSWEPPEEPSLAAALTGQWPKPIGLVLLVHGHGEHMGRYHHGGLPRRRLRLLVLWPVGGRAAARRRLRATVCLARVQHRRPPVGSARPSRAVCAEPAALYLRALDGRRSRLCAARPARRALHLLAAVPRCPSLVVAPHTSRAPRLWTGRSSGPCTSRARCFPSPPTAPSRRTTLRAEAASSCAWPRRLAGWPCARQPLLLRSVSIAR